jgi:hypothetical protein
MTERTNELLNAPLDVAPELAPTGSELKVDRGEENESDDADREVDL